MIIIISLFPYLVHCIINREFLVFQIICRHLLLMSSNSSTSIGLSTSGDFSPFFNFTTPVLPPLWAFILSETARKLDFPSIVCNVQALDSLSATTFSFPGCMLYPYYSRTDIFFHCATIAEDSSSL